MSLPQANSTNERPRPAVDTDRTRSTLVAPLIAVSIGNSTIDSTSSVASPGAYAKIVTVGRLRSGNTSTSRRWRTTTPRSATAPASQSTTARFASENRMIRFSIGSLDVEDEAGERAESQAARRIRHLKDDPERPRLFVQGVRDHQRKAERARRPPCRRERGRPARPDGLDIFLEHVCDDPDTGEVDDGEEPAELLRLVQLSRRERDIGDRARKRGRDDRDLRIAARDHVRERCRLSRDRRFLLHRVAVNLLGPLDLTLPEEIVVVRLEQGHGATIVEIDELLALPGLIEGRGDLSPARFDGVAFPDRQFEHQPS